MTTATMTAAEREAWLAGWSPPFCVTCEVALTDSELKHPRNNGGFDEICDACVARERTAMTEKTAMPSGVELTVRLTAEEVSALQQAREHIRQHMAHQYPWAVRDTALLAIGKVLSAACEGR